VYCAVHVYFGRITPIAQIGIHVRGVSERVWKITIIKKANEIMLKKTELQKMCWQGSQNRSIDPVWKTTSPSALNTLNPPKKLPHTTSAAKIMPN
jgi:hypothetical protein